MLNAGGLFQIGDLVVLVVGLVQLEWGVKKLISDILGGSSSNLHLLVLKNPECGRIEMSIGTEKSHMKELRTKMENVSDHVNGPVIEPGIVITERIGTTETGIGLGTEIGTEKERETVDVTEIEDVTAIVVESGNVIVIEEGIVIGTENMIVIVKGIGIMKLGKLIGDAHMIGRLIMIMLNLNKRRIAVVKESVTLNLRMIVSTTTNRCMDVGMQILTMILITMDTMGITVVGGSMMMEMSTVTITINIMIRIGWKMTMALNEQNLNHVKRREVVMWTVKIVAQRGPIPGNSITDFYELEHNISQIHCC